MGWTSYHATYYKNGKIDRKAECDAYFEEGLNRGHFKVLKSVMKGSVYYAAIQNLKRRVEEDVYEDIPESERTVWAIVFLTSTDKNDYYNFAFKDMDEFCGPYKYDCPESILKLLSPTDNEYALEWRKKCWEKINAKKEHRTLGSLPIGSVIKFRNGNKDDITVFKHKPAYQFKRPFWMRADGSGYISQKFIPDDFTIVSVPNS